MFFAALERGKLVISDQYRDESNHNLDVINRQCGKLFFRIPTARPQYDAGSNGIVARADDIRRKAERANKSDPGWVRPMTEAFDAAFYSPALYPAVAKARYACEQVSEHWFFMRSLAPFICGRFDSKVAVYFSLPDFMPNFLPREMP